MRAYAGNDHELHRDAGGPVGASPEWRRQRRRILPAKLRVLLHRKRDAAPYMIPAITQLYEAPLQNPVGRWIFPNNMIKTSLVSFRS